MGIFALRSAVGRESPTYDPRRDVVLVRYCRLASFSAKSARTAPSRKYDLFCFWEKLSFRTAEIERFNDSGLTARGGGANWAGRNLPSLKR